MIYYRVKPDADNKKFGKTIYIGGELFTPAEAKKYNVNMDYVDAVNISKRRICWFFGARFELIDG